MITQTQISAYERCRRSYYLRYVRKLVWPVDVTDHQNSRQGEDFHLLVRQLLMGFSRDDLLIPAYNENLSRWIDVFLREDPLGKPEMVYPEREVTVNYSGVLWLGKFDALAMYGEKMRIFDWKTTGAKPDDKHYLSAPQTRLYRFLAKTCAARLFGASHHGIPAEYIEMIYWFPEYPEKTIFLPYSEEAYAQDMTWLRTLSREMVSEDEDDYPQTEKRRCCNFCDYRTYCFPETVLSMGSEEFFPPEEDEIQDEFIQMDLFPPDTDREETDF